MAPKPSQQQQEEKRSIKTADQKGRDRFTPYESFGSVQELATLGKIIPLIYTRQGVRVNGQLLWSHLDSQGSSQLLRAIVLFGNGITGRPSFNGYAIGDQLIKNYGAADCVCSFLVVNATFAQTSRATAGSSRLTNTAKPQTVNGRSSCLVIHSRFSTTNI